ncbi:phosphodiester glycosidase family protein [Streptomyces sp. NPDC059994]|uniref:phosphodiester glycosidase family protein n=1 Tax=Streptomyces sp. NPDC059994 TaxID=3347029 RepID=UPI003692BFA8
MTVQTATTTSVQDSDALRVLHGQGYRVADIQALAHDQRRFAVRAAAARHTPAPGIRVQTRSIDLGAGDFTNAYLLRADQDRVRAEVVSSVEGFHLRDRVAPGGGIAAVSGSFAFISDDPSYQPTEPCLDFCCRAGHITSLPTATKPALLVYEGRLRLVPLDARGTLLLQGRSHRWFGSKTPRGEAGPAPGEAVLFGAANCTVQYTDHPRTGFIRHVRAIANTTPYTPAVVDYVVSWAAGTGHRVVSCHPGGGANLFAGSFILRTQAATPGAVRAGATVEITQIAGYTPERLSCGISIGPSVADAADGRTPGYDACLGTSPFRDKRHARTLVGIHGRELVVLVLDGAPKAPAFRGTTPRETATVCAAAGLDPQAMFHLDGGASSKIVFLDRGVPQVRGSMHYLQWPTSPAQPFRWKGLDGRSLHSALVLNTVPSQENEKEKDR